jgi:hypothetical protein
MSAYRACVASDGVEDVAECADADERLSDHEALRQWYAEYAFLLLPQLQDFRHSHDRYFLLDQRIIVTIRSEWHAMPSAQWATFAADAVLFLWSLRGENDDENLIGLGLGADTWPLWRDRPRQRADRKP